MSTKKKSFNKENILRILPVIIPILLTIFSQFGDEIFKPDIKVSLVHGPSDSNTMTQITIENIGSTPATHLRATFNPANDILDHSTGYYTEEIAYSSTGPRNLIGKMDRLANQQKVIVNTILNVTDDNFRMYIVNVAHDDGSTNYTYYRSFDLTLTERIILTIVLIIIIIVAYTLLLVYLKKRKTKKSKDSNQSKTSPSKKSPSSKKYVSVIPPDPFLTISLSKSNYSLGESIVASFSYLGLNVGETIWVGIFDPEDKQIATQRFEVKRKTGEFTEELCVIKNWKLMGTYTIKTDTQFGPGSSITFELQK